MNRVIGALFLAVAVFFTYAVHWSARRQNDAHDRFQPVAARVVSAYVKTSRSGTGSSRTTSYRPEVTYTYTVNGQQYTTKRFQFFGAGHSGYESAQAVTDAYPAGGDVTAYYDPQNPAEAVLDRSPCDLFVVNVGTLAVWGVILGACLYALHRRRVRNNQQQQHVTARETWAPASRRQAS